MIGIKMNMNKIIGIILAIIMLSGCTTTNPTATTDSDDAANNYNYSSASSPSFSDTQGSKAIEGAQKMYSGY